MTESGSASHDAGHRWCRRHRRPGRPRCPRRLRDPGHPQPGAVPLPARVGHPPRRDAARAGRRVRRRRLCPCEWPARCADHDLRARHHQRDHRTGHGVRRLGAGPGDLARPTTRPGRRGRGLVARGEEPAGRSGGRLRSQHPGRVRRGDPRGVGLGLRGVLHVPRPSGAPRGAGRRAGRPLDAATGAGARGVGARGSAPGQGGGDRGGAGRLAPALADRGRRRPGCGRPGPGTRRVGGAGAHHGERQGHSRRVPPGRPQRRHPTGSCPSRRQRRRPGDRGRQRAR